MLQLQFKLIFHSDWHINAGFGLGVAADAIIERDVDGMPIISGTTLKGLYRDALGKLVSLSSVQASNDLVSELLGNPRKQSPWRFGKARPSNVLHLSNLKAQSTIDMGHIVTGVRVDPRYRRAEDRKFFRRELASSELTFLFTVEGDGPQEAVEWLVAAGCFIQRLGSRRQRGLGKCTVSLSDTALQERLLAAFEQRQRGQGTPVVQLDHRGRHFETKKNNTSSRRFRLLLRTEEPLVIARSLEAGNTFTSQLNVPGKTLRGALATLCAANQPSSPDHELFLDLFVLGGIQFTHLLPMFSGKEQGEGYLAGELPLGLVYDPTNPNDVRSALLNDVPEGFRAYKDRHVILTDELPQVESKYLSQNTRMHVHIDEETGRAAANDLYAYQSIPAGRYYVGEMRLDEGRDWLSLARMLDMNLDEPFAVYLGKGRRRGYGHCEVVIQALDDAAPSLDSQMTLDMRLMKNPKSIVLTLTSDTILVDAWGRALQRFEAAWLSQALDIPTDSFKVGQQAVRVTVAEGFDIHSGLPRWRDIALATGSSVALTLIEEDAASLHAKFAKVEAEGIGLRRSEGFGRVIFNPPVHVGLTQGFAGAINIPDVLREKPSDLKLISAFNDWWLHLLDSKNFDRQQFDREEFRTLARHLIVSQPATLNEVIAMLNTLGTPDNTYPLPPAYLKYRVKENRFRAGAIQHLKEWLTYLSEQPQEYWSKGVELLAEAILDAVKRELGEV